MAFEQPLDADKMDDFNLLTAFVRAPLWLLGGVLGRSLLSGGDDTSPQLHCDSNDNQIAEWDDSMNGNSSTQQHDLPKATRELGSLANSKFLARSSTNLLDATTAELSEVNSHNGLRKSKNSLRRTSRLSWSDESGRNLVQYAEENQIAGTGRQTAAGSRPIKSAIKKTSSFRSEIHPSFPASSDGEKRYIPNMNTTNSGGIRMPTQPFSTSSSSSIGVTETESPQWGFYTTLTPPTPEMYRGLPDISLKGANQQPIDRLADTSPSTVAEGANMKSTERYQHNKVFQGLQATKAAPMGWSTIPI